MISKITGLLTALETDAAMLSIPPFEYEILTPSFTWRNLQTKVGEEITLYTIHYIDGNVQKGGRMTPKLIGFNTTVERQFFEVFCSVDGVGVKKALRAMVRPVPDVARAIEEQDVKTLTTLPGIGAATAERIVAKLRRKMAKFALLVQASGSEGVAANASDRSIIEETYEILLSLGHAEIEARKMLDEAMSSGSKKHKDVESLLQAVYERKSEGES